MRSLPKLLGALALLLTLGSCQKEVVTPLPGTTTTGGNSGGTGGNTGNTGGTATDSSYLPLATGNWWKMKDSASGTVQTETVTANSIAYNGHTYSAIYYQPTPNGIDTGYFMHDAVSYRMLALVSAPSIRMEFLYLKDTAVNGTWTADAGSANGFAATINGKVIASNLTMTVQGVTYQKVIHSYMELSYALIGVAATYDYYSAKGVGIIAVYSNAGLPGATQTRVVQELTGYHVN